MLASGTGTILEALVAARLPIGVVLVDRPCRAAGVAEHNGLSLEVVRRSACDGLFDRESYTKDVVARLDPYRVSVVAMAGYATVLGVAMHDAYPGRILNTHPSLLPRFKGWNAVEQALCAGVSESGCTVHIATEAVDEGPVLAAETVPVLAGDSAESLHERIKAVERRIYPAAVRRFLDDMAADDRHAGDRAAGDRRAPADPDKSA